MYSLVELQVQNERRPKGLYQEGDLSQMNWLQNERWTQRERGRRDSRN